MACIEFTQEIYTYQIDAGAHVSNIAYLYWMELGRLKLLNAVGLPIHQTAEHGFFPVLTRTVINYRKPLHLGDTVKVLLWIAELRRVSASLSFQFFDQHNQLVADAMQVGMFIGLSDQRPYRLSPEDRARFEEFLHEAAEPSSAPKPS